MRDQLLDAAARVLQRGGATAVTTRRIATEAGCSEGSIYNHFTTKEELVVAAIAERLASFPTSLAGLPDRAGERPVHEQLAALAEEALDFLVHLAPLLLAGAHDPTSMYEHAARVHAAGGGPWQAVEQIAAWLDRERAAGRIRHDADTRAAATALLGSCLFHAVNTHVWGPGLGPDADTAVRRAALAAWSGLEPETTPPHKDAS